MAKLYDFPRSSASYRVRIACALKGVDYEKVPVDFRADAQRSPDYLLIAPAGLVPAYEADDGTLLTQSLAIIRHLDTTHPQPKLFPDDPKGDCAALEMALAIACDIHPLNNLRVLKYLQGELGAGEGKRADWYAHWVRRGFKGLEARVKDHGGGPYCLGRLLTVADVCLVPQMANARRFDVPLDDFPTLVVKRQMV